MWNIAAEIIIVEGGEGILRKFDKTEADVSSPQ